MSKLSCSILDDFGGAQGCFRGFWRLSEDGAQWSEYSDTPAGFVYLKLAIAQVTAVNVIGHIPIPRVTQKRVVIEDFVFQLVR